ncbi:MAG: TetR/AcrR family transcriptional regulator [Clostridiaceae bacterium]|nr:TetR/AcrR family transcriptional regulator [Clostridiaceae bacterium]
MPKISPEKIQLRKQEILDKAFEIFSTKGYSQTSMEDIVRYSGISKGGIYTHFKSKEEILLTIAEKRFLLRNDRVKQLTDIESPTEKIILYLRWALDGLQNESTQQEICFTIEFWSILSKDSSKSEIAKVRYNKFKKDLEGLLLEGVQKGEFRQDLDTNSTVYLILTSLDGIGFADAVMGIKLSDSVISEYINMIVNYLRR